MDWCWPVATFRAGDSSYVAPEVQLGRQLYYECMRAYGSAAHKFAVTVIGALHYTTGQSTEITVTEPREGQVSTGHGWSGRRGGSRCQLSLISQFGPGPQEDKLHYSLRTHSIYRSGRSPDQLGTYVHRYPGTAERGLRLLV